uniref:Putative secreted peptide n=1 Tax=Anopheles braziliensis TaxID=58242 RepID=A0A2M3ZR42_9DIPT
MVVCTSPTCCCCLRLMFLIPFASLCCNNSYAASVGTVHRLLLIGNEMCYSFTQEKLDRRVGNVATVACLRWLLCFFAAQRLWPRSSSSSGHHTPHTHHFYVVFSLFTPPRAAAAAVASTRLYTISCFPPHTPSSFTHTPGFTAISSVRPSVRPSF